MTEGVRLMTDPQLDRFTMHANWNRPDTVLATISGSGDWVKFSDVSALLIAQAAQVETLTAERDRWQAKAFDLGNGMMEAMAERDEARRTVCDDRHEHMVFNKLATDLWAELIATKKKLAEADR